MVRKLKINLNPKATRARSIPPVAHAATLMQENPDFPDDDMYNPKKPSHAKPASQPSHACRANSQANTQRVEIHTQDEPQDTPAEEKKGPDSHGPAGLRDAKRPPRVYEDSAGLYIMDQGKKKRLVNSQACGNNTQANTQTLNLVLSGLVSKAKRKPRAPRAPKLKPDGKDDGSGPDGPGGPGGGKIPTAEEQAKDPRYILGAQIRQIIMSTMRNARDLDKLLKNVKIAPASATLNQIYAIERRNPLAPGVAGPSFVDQIRGDTLAAPRPPVTTDPSGIIGAADVGGDRKEQPKAGPSSPTIINPSVKPAVPEVENTADEPDDSPPGYAESSEQRRAREARENQRFAELMAGVSKPSTASAAVESTPADDEPVMSAPEMPDIGPSAEAEPEKPAMAAAAAAPDTEPEQPKLWTNMTEEEKKNELQTILIDRTNDKYKPEIENDPFKFFIKKFIARELIVDKNVLGMAAINALLRSYSVISEYVDDQLSGTDPEVFQEALQKVLKNTNPDFMSDFFDARAQARDQVIPAGTKDTKSRIYANRINKIMTRMATQRKLTGKGKSSLMVGLSDAQINDMLRGYPEYMGCISRDEISKLNVPDVGRFGFVYNTVPSTRPTVNEGHWRAVFIDLDNDKEIDHYDSYGDPAEPDICEEVKQLLDPFKLPYYLKWKDNRIVEQRANSNNCGYFATNFLMDRFAGKPFRDATGYSNVAAGERKARGLNRKFKYMT